MPEQFQQAITEYRQRIYSFAHYSLRTREDAEDITQEVFIKLWQHWQRVDHAKLNAWLMRVAHNAVIDHVRKRRNRLENTDRHADPDAQPAPEQDAGQKMDNTTTRAELQRCIHALKDPFRSILIMRDVQGQSYADIQHSLEMSESQVKVYLHRARRQLRADPQLRQSFKQISGSGEQVP